MAKAKKKTRKKAARKQGSAREENPAWLCEAPSGGGPNPPVETRPGRLNFLELTWPDFERLCYRLAQKTGAVEKAWAYGTSGYGQLGIDILVRMKAGGFQAWQSKRYRKFGLEAAKDAVKTFTAAKWANQANRFVLAVACPINDPKVIDYLEKARTRLKKRGIAFEPLFETELTEKLKVEAEIIDEFFGRDWVEKICGPEAATALGDRVSRIDVAALRSGLRQFYAVWIGTVDPGLPLAGQAATDAPAPELGERYVIPDLLVEPGAGEHTRVALDQPTDPTTAEVLRNVDPQSTRGSRGIPIVRPAEPAERRTSLDEFLVGSKRSLITAEAGGGKTTLLRFLALQLLSDTSALPAVRDNYADCVPIWVPFALWARMAEGKPTPPTLDEVVDRFVRALNEPQLAEKLRRVMRTNRVVLLVDGLDETREQSTADALIVSLTIFAQQTNVPVLATSRPHGLKALSGIGGTWQRARIAPLSEAQRGLLALLWYRILERQELGAAAAPTTIERQAKNRAESFIKALQASPGITRLAQTPLFLLSLLKLHRLRRDLPRNRFDASKEIVEQLVDHQPKRRAKDAMKTEPVQRMRNLRDRLLEDFACALQAGELKGNVADGAFETDTLARASGVVSRTGSKDAEYADEQARAVFAFGEETAGLLVRKAQDSIGFLHRSLREYFAGSHLAQLSLEARISFIRSHAGQPIWKEPILYLLYLLRNEQEVGLLIDAIDQGAMTDVGEASVRDALLTEATFADFAHDMPKVQRVAERLFSEAEMKAWGARQRELVAAVVDGLFSQSVSTRCAAKLAEWIPDYHGWGRHGAILALQNWDKAMRPACIPVLLRVLAGDLDNNSRAAGHVLAKFAGGDQEVKDRLLRLVHEPRSIETLRAALFTLGQGWGGDADVGALAAALRRTPLAGLQLDAIRIRISRGEADLSDLDIFTELTFKRDRSTSETTALDLVDYFAARHKAELLARLEDALNDSKRRRFDIALVGTLIAADPHHERVESLLRDMLVENWVVDQMFSRSNIPLDRVTWTPSLIQTLEATLTKARHADFEWYWVSKVLPLPSVKERMIASMKAGSGLTFWSSRGLSQFWGKKDAAVRQAFAEMLDAPAKAFAEAADDAAMILDDRTAVRTAILRALREKPHETRFLIGGLRRIGISVDDDEAFHAAFEAGDPKGRYMDADHWREAMIRTFPSRPEVRAMADAELTIRDGNLDAVAEVYAADKAVCSQVLQLLAPLPDSARLSLVAKLGAAAPSNTAAFERLAVARHDTYGATAGEAVMAWTDALLARNAFGAAERAFLVDELEAVGPEFHDRRAAAVVGLTLTDHLSDFAKLKDHQGKPLDIDVAQRMGLDKSDRYLKRILPHWDRVTEALGGDEGALARLELSSHRGFPILNPGVQNAEHLFRLLDSRTTPQTPLYERLGAVQRFAHDGPLMRRLIEPLLLSRGSTRNAPLSNSQRWPSLMAAEIFADHFAQTDLRKKVIDHFKADPRNESAAEALAETSLREPSPDLADLLRAEIKRNEYGFVASFRVAAAIGDIVGALEWLFKTDPTDTVFWNCSYWVPAFLRRIERDEDVADDLIDALDRAPSASARLSELALLGLGCKDKAKTRPVLTAALKTYEAAPAPVIAFDLTANAYRPALHTVCELLT